MKVSVRGIEKSYGKRSARTVVLQGIDLEIDQGEMVCLVGPSGCGKTTLLRSIAGLATPDGGEIAIGGRTVFGTKPAVDVKPEDRDIGMVFQSYALWPHMRVEQNVAFPLRMRKWRKARIAEAVAAALKLVGCDELGHRYPSELSGGQQQRIALARALVAEPELVLFDEPLSNLDIKLRQSLRYEIRDLQKRVGFTGLYVTHDQEEAWALADRVVVMRDGSVVQQGAPRAVHRSPATEFVARFIGDMNVMAGKFDDDGDAAAVIAAGGRYLGRPTSPRLQPGDAAFLAIPEDKLELFPVAAAPLPRREQNRWCGRVQQVSDLGRRLVASVELHDGVTWRVELPAVHEVAAGDDLVLTCPVEDTLIVASDRERDVGP